MTTNVQLDCWCGTCGRQITLDELQQNFHSSHHFELSELTALQIMRDFLRLALPQQAAY